jgi:nitroreductase
MSNAVIGAVFARRSVRAYTAQKVDAETADLLARAALAAPSGMNSQPVDVIAVRNRALIEEAARHEDRRSYWIYAGKNWRYDVTDRTWKPALPFVFENGSSIADMLKAKGVQIG